MRIVYSTIAIEQNNIIGISPQKAHFNDSGFDLFAPTYYSIKPKSFITIDTLVKFKLELPWYLRFLNIFGIGIHANVQPKSGRSKNGLEISLGEIDEGYRGCVGITLYNRTNKEIFIKEKEKIAQITFNIIFNRIKLIKGNVDTKTSRGQGGFGSSGT